MRFHPWTVLPAVLAFVAAQGCASSIKVSEMRVILAPPASARAITIEVYSPVPRIEPEEVALANGLRDEFAAPGYQVGSGDLVSKATIVKLRRDKTTANVTLGLGIGSDAIAVSVALGDTKGTPYMTFLVHGPAIDKRYSDLCRVIGGVARKTAEEVKRAGK